MRTSVWAKRVAHACLLLFLGLSSIAAHGQDEEIKPVPILVGYPAYFTRVTGGQVQDAPSFSPLLLVPLGDKWLIEAKGNLSDTYAKNPKGDYIGTVSYGLGYAQIDYIANRFVTVPAGTDKVNLNYAFYFSTVNTNHLLATDRSTGGRIGFFMPGPRLEIGASFQQLLQADRSHAVGLHAEWQPNALPLTLRSEYAHSSGIKGSGYWIESVYRLNQLPYLRRLEVAGRAQQFFAAPKLTKAVAAKLGALGRDTNQADFGLNYYLRSDVRASASYGRQFALGKNANIWVIGMTYRFIMPLGPASGAKGGTL